MSSGGVTHKGYGFPPKWLLLSFFFFFSFAQPCSNCFETVVMFSLVGEHFGAGYQLFEPLTPEN